MSEAVEKRFTALEQTIAELRAEIAKLKAGAKKKA